MSFVVLDVQVIVFFHFDLFNYSKFITDIPFWSYSVNLSRHHWLTVHFEIICVGVFNVYAHCFSVVKMLLAKHLQQMSQTRATGFSILKLFFGTKTALMWVMKQAGKANEYLFIIFVYIY